jgi:hypothetical protein
MLAMTVLIAVGPSQAQADIINGSFETGDFSGWSRGAFVGFSPDTGGPTYQTFATARTTDLPISDTNAVITSQTTAFDNNGPVVSTPVGPTNGRFLAFLSNATTAGDGVMTGSFITQTFTLPKGSQTLSFDVRLLNNDDAISFPVADDFGGVALLRGSTLLGQYNLDLDQTSGANGHVVADTLTGGFYNSSTWRHVTFDASGSSGANVTLTAYVMNYGGDNFVESRLLLDNVQVPAVPAPPAAILLGSGIGALGLCRRFLGMGRANGQQ